MAFVSTPPYLNAMCFQFHHGGASEGRAGWHNGKFEQLGGQVWDETRGCSMILFESYFILNQPVGTITWILLYESCGDGANQVPRE